MKKHNSPEHRVHLTYRTRRALRRTGITLASVALVLGIVLLCWFNWLSRFVVYSADGARLDFETDYDSEEAVEALPPEQPTVQIYYNEGDNKLDTSTELTRIAGCYVTTDMLLDSVENVAAAIRELPKGCAVALDLKSGFGNFYYSADVSGASVSTQVDAAAVDQLIAELDGSDTYLIARIPAFRDRNYGLNHFEYGLPVADGSHLWADDDQCYWLDPTSNGTMAYLISILSDLRNRGFDEVVLTDFAFPPTDNLRFTGDRGAALQKAAETLVTGCATSTFAVSFESSDPAFVLPDGRTRLFLTGVDAEAAKAIADSFPAPLPDAQLVFRTDSSDTRFDAAGVLRPLPSVEVLP